MADPALLRFAGRLSRGETDAALQHRLRDRGLVLRQQQADDDPAPDSQDGLIQRLPLLNATEIEAEIAKWPAIPALAPCRKRLRQLSSHLDEVSKLPSLAPDLCSSVLTVLSAAPGDSRARQRLIDQFASSRGSSLAEYHLQLRQIKLHGPNLWRLEESFLGTLTELCPDAEIYFKVVLFASPILVLITLAALIFWPERQPQIKPLPKPKATAVQSPDKTPTLDAAALTSPTGGSR